jgi:hypothetical protein
MKPEPAAVRRISLSRKSLRTWTSGESSEPKVAVAIKQDGNFATVVVEAIVEVEVVDWVREVVVVAELTEEIVAVFVYEVDVLVLLFVTEVVEV